MMEYRAGDVLLAIARSAIARELGRTHECSEDAHWLREPGACFVTLNLEDRLRGCIGTLQAHRALLDDVKANARNAAFRDPRFKPLSLAELDRLTVEVSLLSPLEPLNAQDERDALAQLRPGIDGLVFEYGHHRSTYLPQVWEDLPEPWEFLSSLRQKAGLPPNFWEPGVKLARYTVSKWSEAAEKP